MSGSYVPPHMLKQAQGVAEIGAETNAALNLTMNDIINHYWPTKELRHIYEESPNSVHARGNKTLHDSGATPGRLTYIILFDEANPKWETENIIFTKSNLELLPSSLANGTQSSLDSPVTSETKSHPVNEGCKLEPAEVEIGVHDPIAVFKQSILSSMSKTANYDFHGWYKIEHIAFLEPHSVELVRMLEQKWTRTDRRGNIVSVERDQAHWQQSLGYRWAVVKFAKEEAAQQDRGNPKIEKLPFELARAGEPKKSVKELLAEMRLEDASKHEALPKA